VSATCFNSWAFCPNITTTNWIVANYINEAKDNKKITEDVYWNQEIIFIFIILYKIAQTWRYFCLELFFLSRPLMPMFVVCILSSFSQKTALFRIVFFIKKLFLIFWIYFLTIPFTLCQLFFLKHIFLLFWISFINEIQNWCRQATINNSKHKKAQFYIIFGTYSLCILAQQQFFSFCCVIISAILQKIKNK